MWHTTIIVVSNLASDTLKSIIAIRMGSNFSKQF